jgi:sugar phosphate isomerase/epimerase
MRLAASNLAWSEENLEPALAILAEAGITGVEIAPGRLADWPDLDARVVAAYAARLARDGFTVPALQAVLYRQPGPQLLADAAAFDALRAHLRRVSLIAADLGAAVMVFGAPANRRRGTLPPDAAAMLATDRLRRIGDAIAPIRLGLEPVPPQAGADFLTTGAATLALVRAVDHPCIGFHLDAAAAAAAGEDPAGLAFAAGPALCHAHASQPGLGDFAAPLHAHRQMRAGLAARGWDGWVSIEMLAKGDELARLRQAVGAVRRLFAPGSSAPAPGP